MGILKSRVKKQAEAVLDDMLRMVVSLKNDEDVKVQANGVSGIVVGVGAFAIAGFFGKIELAQELVALYGRKLRNDPGTKSAANELLERVNDVYCYTRDGMIKSQEEHGNDIGYQITMLAYCLGTLLEVQDEEAALIPLRDYLATFLSKVK